VGDYEAGRRRTGSGRSAKFAKDRCWWQVIDRLESTKAEGSTQRSRLHHEFGLPKAIRTDNGVHRGGEFARYRGCVIR
jgi:hypothetical protein